MKTLLLLISLSMIAATPARALTGTLFGMGAGGELYAVDPSDASLTSLGTLAGVTSASGLAWDPMTASLWFADRVGSDILIKQVDLGSITASLVVAVQKVPPIANGTTGHGFEDATLRDIAFLPNGSLYGIGWTAGTGARHELYSIDRTTGAGVSLIEGLPGGLSVLDATTLLYLGGDGVIDLGTLTPTMIAGFTGDLTNRGTQMTYAADEDATYFLENCQLSSFCPGQPLYRVDRTLGVYTRIGPPTFALTGIAVPEPGPTTLAIATLIALTSARRRA